MRATSKANTPPQNLPGEDYSLAVRLEGSLKQCQVTSGQIRFPLGMAKWRVLESRIYIVLHAKKATLIFFTEVMSLLKAVLIDNLRQY